MEKSAPLLREVRGKRAEKGIWISFFLLLASGLVALYAGCRSTNANIMPGTMNSGTSPCQKSRMFREGEASARAMNSTIEYFASSDG